MSALKDLFKSRTNRGIFVSLIAGLLPAMGIQMDEGSVSYIVNQLFIVGGALYGVYGRVNAKGPIELRKKA